MHISKKNNPIPKGFLYTPLILYIGYSIHKYTKDKSKSNLLINIGVAGIIQGMTLVIYGTYEYHIKKNNVNLSCIKKNQNQNDKKVRFHPDVSIRIIENRLEDTLYS